MDVDLHERAEETKVSAANENERPATLAQLSRLRRRAGEANDRNREAKRYVKHLQQSNASTPTL